MAVSLPRLGLGAAAGPHGVEPPLAGDALEGVGAAILEGDLRARDQVFQVLETSRRC